MRRLVVMAGFLLASSSIALTAFAQTEAQQAAPAEGAALPKLHLSPLMSAGEQKALAKRLEAIDKRPASELKRALAIKDPLERRLLLWAAALQAPEDDVPLSAFDVTLAPGDDWPDYYRIQRKAENAMPDRMSRSETLKWFAKYPPLSGLAKLRYATALLGDKADAPGGADPAAMLREGWRTAWSDAREEAAILKKYGGLLDREDHLARFEFLFEWQAYSLAQRMLPLMDKDRRALAEARLALRSFAPNVDAMVARVPKDLRDDAGLVLDRAYWRRIKGLDDGARDMLLTETDPMRLMRPELLWREHHLHARSLLREGKYAEAYKMAASHGLRTSDGDGLRGDRIRVAYAEAEWLSGWIALRFLDRPAAARGHFQKLYDAVTTTVSRSRAAYWLGRAAEAEGDQATARQWYGVAAADDQRFYGQLAASHLGRGVKIGAPAMAAISDQARDAFLARDDVKAARLLSEVGADKLLSRFVRHLAAKAKTPSETALIAALGETLRRPDLPLYAAKEAEDRFASAQAFGYPVVELPKSLQAHASLAHAIIRQESAFDYSVVSPVGARGLMQLMPATAKRYAKQAGLPYQRDKLTQDPDYNMQVAARYVAKLEGDFDGATVLMIAAYNAGENAVARWVRTYGDPRKQGVDVVDWIEMIPYGETRNYVQRVLEAMTVYATRFGDLGPSPSLPQILSHKAGRPSGS